jgi:hypothetical protein
MIIPNPPTFAHCKISSRLFGIFTFGNWLITCSVPQVAIGDNGLHTEIRGICKQPRWKYRELSFFVGLSGNCLSYVDQMNTFSDFLSFRYMTMI